MAKHLTTMDIKAILNIIHGNQSNKITWEGVCEAAEHIIGKKPTRQSLYSHESIKEAFKSKKNTLKTKRSGSPRPSNLNAAADRIAKLQSENECLKRKNEDLLEQFVTWQYNSYKYGIQEHQLNEPLPRIDRERTE